MKKIALRPQRAQVAKPRLLDCSIIGSPMMWHVLRIVEKGEKDLKRSTTENAERGIDVSPTC
jgi:hypothetical protein